MPSSMRRTGRSEDDLRRHHSDGGWILSCLTRPRLRTVERKSSSGLRWTVNGQRINAGTFVSTIVENPPPAIAKPVFEVGTDGPVHVGAAIEPAAPA